MTKPTRNIIRANEKGYRQCSVTLMDTTDPDIQFDADGRSNWVEFFETQVAPVWNPNGKSEEFQNLVKRIKEEGKLKPYDCLIGLSGGVDSSYVAYLAWKNGLRPLVLHTDTGWNSELAVKNIEQIVKTCGFDLHTQVVDWSQMADLQRAFLYSGVPNQDIPQDHAISAAFFGYAAKHRIKWVLSGVNYATESVLPVAWGHGARDLKHLKAIHKRFGREPLGDFPQMGYLRFGVKYLLFSGIKIVMPLNMVKYNFKDAVTTLEEEFGWRYYGAKHYESRWTRFFQGWWLPEKFGFDKRLAHLSSLILAGQLTRDEAFTELKTTNYSAHTLNADRELVAKKLDLSEHELMDIFHSPNRSHFDYPTGGISKKLFELGKQFHRSLYR